MLSENLRSLRDRFYESTDSGVVIGPRGVDMIRAVLEAAIEDARELEARTVPIADRVDDLPDNVVRIAKVLNKKGARVGPRLHKDPGGGDPEDAA